MLHYHLAILLLVDIVDASQRTDLLQQLIPHREEAESWTFNCLEFGLNNHFTISLPSSLEIAEGADGRSVTIPIVKIDPYQHHVVAVLQLLHKAIRRELETESITLDVYNNMFQTLLRTVDQLPRYSKSVQAASEGLRSPRSPF